MSSVILRFAIEMQNELDRNNHKSGWHGLSPKWLIHRMKQEVAELEKAVKKEKPREEIQSECADVANFAMMLSNNFMDGRYFITPHGFWGAKRKK